MMQGPETVLLAEWLSRGNAIACVFTLQCAHVAAAVEMLTDDAQMEI